MFFHFELRNESMILLFSNLDIIYRLDRA